MGYILLILFFVSLFFAVLWANSIHETKEKHPDYKGDDFLNWDNDYDSYGND